MRNRKLRYSCLLLTFLVACGGGSSSKNSELTINNSDAYSVRTESNGIATQTFYYDDTETKFTIDSKGMRSETRINGELIIEEEY